EGTAASECLVGVASRFHCAIGHERHDRIDSRVHALDLLQMRAENRDRRDLFCLDERRQFDGAQSTEIVFHCGGSPARRNQPPARYSSAAATPPRANGTRDRASPISTPASVPASIKSLKSPRCPIRNTLPFSLPRPVPSDMLERSRTVCRNASA